MSGLPRSVSSVETPEMLLERHRIQISDILSRTDLSTITQPAVDSWTCSLTEAICPGRSLKFTTAFLRLLRSQVYDTVASSMIPLTDNLSRSRRSNPQSLDVDDPMWVTVKFSRGEWPQVERHLQDRGHRFVVIGPNNSPEGAQHQQLDHLIEGQSSVSQSHDIGIDRSYLSQGSPPIGNDLCKAKQFLSNKPSPLYDIEDSRRMLDEAFAMSISEQVAKLPKNRPPPPEGFPTLPRRTN